MYKAIRQWVSPLIRERARIIEGIHEVEEDISEVDNRSKFPESFSILLDAKLKLLRRLREVNDKIEDDPALRDAPIPYHIY